MHKFKSVLATAFAVASLVASAGALAQAEISIGEAGWRFIDEASTRSRAEVLAELHEAIRLGYSAGGEAGPRLLTAEQEAKVIAAGKAAAGRHAAASGKRPA